LRATTDGLVFQLRDEPEKGACAVIAHGRFARLGTSAAFLEIQTDDEPYSESVRATDHKTALRYLVDYLHRNAHIARLSDIAVCVHWLSHGAHRYRYAQRFSHDDIRHLHAVRHLSPDNPAAISTMSAALKQLPGMHVLVPDTGFTSTLPPEAATIAVPKGVARKFHLHRFGAKGIVHRAIHDAGLAMLGRPKPSRVITVHIDDDVTVCAVLDGTVVETTAGFTIAEGLPGLHRTGSLDPRIPLHLSAHLGADPRSMDKLLGTRCGIAGIAHKHTYDEIVAGAVDGDPRCALALMTLSYRVAREIAGMTASLGGIDAIIFAGAGAHWTVREEILRRLSGTGAHIMPDAKRTTGVFHARTSGVRIAAVIVDEDDALVSEAIALYRIDAAGAASQKTPVARKALASRKALVARPQRHAHKTRAAPARRTAKRRPARTRSR
jgi:acetate kinase